MKLMQIQRLFSRNQYNVTFLYYYVIACYKTACFVVNDKGDMVLLKNITGFRISNYYAKRKIPECIIKENLLQMVKEDFEQSEIDITDMTMEEALQMVKAIEDAKTDADDQ